MCNQGFSDSSMITGNSVFAVSVKILGLLRAHFREPKSSWYVVGEGQEGQEAVESLMKCWAKFNSFKLTWTRNK